MTTLREAAQQALEALEKYRKMMFVEAGCRFGEGDSAITALRAALAEQPAGPDAEPVAWRWLYRGSPDSEKCFPMPGPDADVIAKAGASEFPRTVQYLYTAPQPAKPAEQEPVALLHDDGYWTAAKTDAGRRLSERLLFAGSPSIAVYTAPQPRRRLTDEEIDNTTRKQVDDLLDHIYEYGTAAEGIIERVRAIARAIERAHGIGEQP